VGPTVLAPMYRSATVQRGPHVALDVLELWVRDLSRTEHLLTTTFGFEPLDERLRSGPDEEVACVACGRVTVVLRQGTSPESPIDRHVAVHGDTVGDLALLCGDAGGLVERARAHGLDVSGEGDCRRIDLTGDGTICHSVRQNRLVSSQRETLGAPRMQAVDHVTHCLSSGTAESVAKAYEEVFGLQRVDVGDLEQVGGDMTGMRSIVLRSPLGFTVVLTEPASPAGTGQTQRFIDAHAGPGVQHAAFAYDDLCAAVGALRSKGVNFLPAPGGYYEQSRERLSDVPLSWDALQRLDILVDADDDGLLFQLFTRPITDRGTFFIELIQRSGASGFGANNVRALFAAVDAAMREGV